MKCDGPKNGPKYFKNCSQTKPCEEDCFGIPDHPLLHDKSRATKNTRTAVARTMDQANVDKAMGMLRLALLDRDGRPISAHVFKDEESNTSLMWKGFERALIFQGKLQVLAVEGAGGVYQSLSMTGIKHPDSHFFRTGSRVKVLNYDHSRQPDSSYGLASFDTPLTHRSDVPVTKTGGRVDNLIGLDYGQLTAAIESRIGEGNEPVT